MQPDTFRLLQGAVALRASGRLSEAETVARAALAANPEESGVRWVLSTILLLQGRYAEGFPLFEARHEFAPIAVPKPKLPYREWRGEPVSRLLVWFEQGFGDQIQAARFAAPLAEQAKVTWVCPPPLARLFRASLPVEVLETALTITFDDPDAWVMPFGIPSRIGVERPEDIPNAPYLRTPEDARERWRGFARPGRNIAVAWRGNPQHPNDGRRSMPSPDLLAPLARFGTVHDLVEPRGDFADTAAILEQMDLVVSVDTSLAHLAGALGRPCRILLPAEDPDWRWIWGREDTPWYPSARLVRQASPGDWASAVQQVVHELSG